MQESLISETAGLTSLQLAQLCQASRIEHTLHLLFHMNHWAKARERLFFADRQGLYQVKAAILRQAYAVGAIEACAYVDGAADFGKDITLEMAADIAAEVVIERLEDLSDASMFANLNEYDHMACGLYTRVTGRKVSSAADICELDVQLMREFIYTRLRDLEARARATRRPIPCPELAALCIAPGDLLYIHGNRFYTLGNWDSWDELDASERRMLDPEGLSLIAFRYSSSNAHYVFHLPFRLAEEFLPQLRICELQRIPTTSRERGEYYGRSITEAECLEHPVEAILGELGVNVAAVCPKLLTDKQEHFMAQAMLYTMWGEDEDFADEDEDLAALWSEDELPEQKVRRCKKKKKSRKHREPGHPTTCCPLCKQKVSPPGLPRLEHWRQAHYWHDLTVSQVRWLVGNVTSKHQFYLDFPPDYRLPNSDKQASGTRYWKLETLRGRLETNSLEVGDVERQDQV
ncbi:hypothetical protein EPA93_29925 [Ktedonosporobacter rubrisoli]|uniref:Uncharacterized protein n=1 Tax=Ktedonosporobacter rubrisoli TaxID=2509675 RepID=A0A4P6JWW8_KTERU|nr:hypothetical protein [Ktedonosporobacter rubrisoli]QBD79975.1 hypothetical protein EPA93_29925 [Ktedonosporobacter rubrisoli]